MRRLNHDSVYRRDGFGYFIRYHCDVHYVDQSRRPLMLVLAIAGIAALAFFLGAMFGANRAFRWREQFDMDLENERYERERRDARTTLESNIY